MKIKRLSVKNVTSYKDRTDFLLDTRLNIMIGPNGGGKSNLQKIIALVMSSFFIRQYDFKYTDDERKIDPIDLWNRRTLERTLCRYIDDPSDQEIELELAPEASDISNIRAIAATLPEFNSAVSWPMRRVTSGSVSSGRPSSLLISGVMLFGSFLSKTADSETNRRQGGSVDSSGIRHLK